LGEVAVNDAGFTSQRQGSTGTGTVLKNLVESWQLGMQGEPGALLGVGASAAARSQDILQIDRTYLVCAGSDGLIIVDQHAAHERILYEQFKAALEKELATGSAVALEPAVLLPVSAAQLLLLEKLQPTLQEIGFELESFGSNTVKISAVPAVVADRDLAQLLSEILDDLAAGQPVAEVDRATHRTLAYVACRSAIKAGDYLPLEQRRELLEKLSQTPNHFTCPHGRPTILNWSVTELEKLFKRR
jgi:DNA mismatch repair protein MutL